MKVRSLPLFLLRLFLLALISASAPTILAENPPSCHIAVTSPVAGASVGRAAMVEGTATVPAGERFLWAFARIKGEVEAWPQGGGPLLLDDRGGWAVHVYFGERDDIGSDFEVILQVVEKRDNTLLDAWVQNAKQQRPPSSIKLPPSVEGCSVARLTVKKVSH
jgi:hypothetical protein